MIKQLPIHLFWLILHIQMPTWTIRKMMNKIWFYQFCLYVSNSPFKKVSDPNAFHSKASGGHDVTSLTYIQFVKPKENYTRKKNYCLELSSTSWNFFFILHISSVIIKILWIKTFHLTWCSKRPKYIKELCVVLPICVNCFTKG